MCGQLMNILLIIPVASDLRRVKRQSEESASKGPAASAEGEAESEAEAPPKSEGVSLGKILGLVFLACCILYCIGISWKVYKVCKGTYVEEEPVFLKYKWRSQKKLHEKWHFSGKKTTTTTATTSKTKNTLWWTTKTKK